MNVQQQGEVRIERIAELPKGDLVPHNDRNADGAYIISHSEKGHHHVIPDGDAEVLVARPSADGMQRLYAIVKNPTAMVQTASTAHQEAPMQPGVYELTISREYDPFSEQARRVAD